MSLWVRFLVLSFNTSKADDIRTYVSANNTDYIRTYKSVDIIQRYLHLCSSTENIWTQV